MLKVGNGFAIDQVFEQVLGGVEDLLATAATHFTVGHLEMGLGDAEAGLAVRAPLL